MDRIPTEISSTESVFSTTTSTEKRTLSDVLHSGKRSGGNYGSLAKSQSQRTFYIYHKIESEDTLQRLALKYSINIQEIKRVNKLYSDAELGLLGHVYIPVNSTQLSTLQTQYPTLNIVQNLSPSMNRIQKSMTNAILNDETTSSIRSSDSSPSIPSTLTTNNSSYQDYFSKIDQQIRLSKKSLQTLDSKEQSQKSQSTETSPSHNQSTMRKNERHKGVHHLSDNSAFINIKTQNTRNKHISVALERIQREKDNLEEL